MTLHGQGEGQAEHRDDGRACVDLGQESAPRRSSRSGQDYLGPAWTRFPTEAMPPPSRPWTPQALPE
jgi:hypothetical protein